MDQPSKAAINACCRRKQTINDSLQASSSPGFAAMLNVFESKVIRPFALLPAYLPCRFLLLHANGGKRKGTVAKHSERKSTIKQIGLNGLWLAGWLATVYNEAKTNQSNLHKPHLVKPGAINPNSFR